MAMERAKEIEASLPREHPCLIKVMQRSHVSKPFYMNPSSPFCGKYLPKTNEMLLFEAESGQTYKVRYLGDKRAFSGGWKGFAEAEKLLENDVLVFHMVGRCKFKVYIVRASEFSQVDEAPTVVTTEAEVEKKTTFERDKKRLRFEPVEVLPDNFEASNSMLKMEESKPKRLSSEKMREFLDKRSDHYKASSPEAMQRAKEIQAKLSTKYPSFIKLIMKSHVSRPFRMLPPSEFSENYLPINEKMYVFEVENGNSYDVKYICTKWAFSSGWKGFRDGEKLLENDILVFQLVSSFKFKVYIVRANEFRQVNETPPIVKLEDCETDETVEAKEASEREQKRLKFVPVDLSKEKLKVRNSSFKPSETISEFRDFKIVVNGTRIEFPEAVKLDYYKLCCSQKSYLHRHLINSVDHELAASIISKTVTISSAIRESKSFTPREDIISWCKLLDGFEKLGMEVGFIKARLNRLSDFMEYAERCKEAETERDRVVKEIRELEKVKRGLDDKIEGMKKVGATYEKEASAPW